MPVPRGVAAAGGGGEIFMATDAVGVVTDTVCIEAEVAGWLAIRACRA